MSEKLEVKVGKIVKLKSGGPDMTVVSTTVDERKCKCTWWNECTGKYDQGEFLCACVLVRKPKV